MSAAHSCEGLLLTQTRIQQHVGYAIAAVAANLTQVAMADVRKSKRSARKLAATLPPVLVR